MNGKGSSPRNCFSKKFKENYEEIEWREKGAYCMECGNTFLKPYDEKHLTTLSDGTEWWICSKTNECSRN